MKIFNFHSGSFWRIKSIIRNNQKSFLELWERPRSLENDSEKTSWKWQKWQNFDHKWRFSTFIDHSDSFKKLPDTQDPAHAGECFAPPLCRLLFAAESIRFEPPDANWQLMIVFGVLRSVFDLKWKFWEMTPRLFFDELSESSIGLFFGPQNDFHFFTSGRKIRRRVKNLSFLWWFLKLFRMIWDAWKQGF